MQIIGHYNLVKSFLLVVKNALELIFHLLTCLYYSKCNRISIFVSFIKTIMIILCEYLIK
ncbi:Uncharacterised protein [Bacteroides faecis]|uniref:Uncharacterized protein n=1 Tax=Bacteroides faecis TaxID=674529 RepID=A0A6N2TDS3_9BACE